MPDEAILATVRTVLSRHPDVGLAIVFGSAASAPLRPDSDVDVAIQARAPLDSAEKMRLIAELAQATGRAVDLVDLRVAGEPLLGQVLRHGRRVAGDDATYAELARRHLIDAADFMPYVERILRERRQAWIGK